MTQGVNRYPRRKAGGLEEEEKRIQDRLAEQERSYNDLWRTVPQNGSREKRRTTEAERRQILGLPEENVLYFLEKKAPLLKPWQREVLRIVRHIAQYFYPQKQTKVMNEGCATMVHYETLNRLHEKGLLGDGAMVEFLTSHTNVVLQPDFDDRRYGGINPYALGFGMMQDIKRICLEPTDEDRAWFPGFAGNGDPWGTLKDGWANYRDESFIRQFLSPALIRKMKLFAVVDDGVSDLVVKAIHNERGYQTVRSALARQFDVAQKEPEIEIVDVDLDGDRRLMLQHRVYDNVLLAEEDIQPVLRHLADLWGYEVSLSEISASSEAVLKQHTAGPTGALAAT
jgi:stage V sporulation protein R